MNVLEAFKPYEYVDGPARMKYRLFEPNVESGKRYPLVVFLHGAGERGDDNERHITANEGATVWVRPDVQAKHPCFVLAPQCPQDGYWGTSFRVEKDPYKLVPNCYVATVLLIIEELLSIAPIDEDRIYVTGLSMGGFGTIALLTLNPQLFAAGVVVCGGGNPERLHRIKHIPLWLFHAEDDDIVPVTYSRVLVQKLKEIGGKVRYTEYPAGYMNSLGLPPHASWVPAYRTEEMISWLFEQRRCKE
ncbi:alpha/beta fold hydrolase [Fervidobacterium thailandense]|uniref:Phospholipase n=1 Tax=Fervidobacterium thailandense TaxID=1008305 RepID=A0A1E3G413_9BACT|nr:alpha/beta fold hydrolase [Fervidobacterium thailandense]ODN30428.1 phospholipase [Fervidobacterium thailandense]